MLNILTELHGAFGLLAYFGMVTTQGNQLFTNRTTPIVFTFTISGVRNYAFHFVTTRRATIGISTLTGMNQALKKRHKKIVNQVNTSMV